MILRISFVIMTEFHVIYYSFDILFSFKLWKSSKLSAKFKVNIQMHHTTPHDRELWKFIKTLQLQKFLVSLRTHNFLQLNIFYLYSQLTFKTWHPTPKTHTQAIHVKTAAADTSVSRDSSRTRMRAPSSWMRSTFSGSGKKAEQTFGPRSGFTHPSPVCAAWFCEAQKNNAWGIFAIKYKYAKQEMPILVHVMKIWSLVVT